MACTCEYNKEPQALHSSSEFDILCHIFNPYPANVENILTPILLMWNIG